MSIRGIETSKEAGVEISGSKESIGPTIEVKEMSKDEHRLAVLGYKQVFVRSFGMFENWAATFTTMNFVSGMPVLFGFAMYTGGPQAAFANWTMIGGLSTFVSLAMAEIAASLPTAGGIYYWAYRLGGDNHGPLLSWLTAWYNFVGWITIIPGLSQGTTNFLVSAFQLTYPNVAVIDKPWFGWCLSTCITIVAMVPNIWNQTAVRWMLRSCVYSTVLLVAIYLIWFPIAANRRGGFQSADIFTTFYNGINYATDANGNIIKQASDSYCWVVGILFGAWEFYGYDASVHLSEETYEASAVVARGMWTGTVATWLGSVPILALVMVCMQDFMGVVNGGFANNWAAYLEQLVGTKGAVAILVLTWFDGILCTGVCILSAQRITFAIARDRILPFGPWLSKLGKNHLPVNAAVVVVIISIAINASVIGSYVAFTALTAATTVGTNLSYLIPIVARHTVGRKDFQVAEWNLGRWTIPITCVASAYIGFLFVVLMLPQLYPVDANTLNYCPVIIGGITIIALGGWVFPFGLGGRYWFKGPVRTISEVEVQQARVKQDDMS